jgi:hypothetical protein
MKRVLMYKLQLWQPNNKQIQFQISFFEGVVKMSAYQPIDIKPLYGRKWVTNGVNNVNLKRIKMRMMMQPDKRSIQCVCELCVVGID